MARIGQARIYGRGQEVKPKLTSQATVHGLSTRLASGSMSARFHDPRLRGIGAEDRPMDLDDLIDKVRRRLNELEIVEVLKLEKFFKEADGDKSGTLDSKEFINALMAKGILQSEDECNKVFKYFDEDGNGTIDAGEFMTIMKGKLPEKRRAVVREAFASLDMNGDGVLSVEDLRKKYRSFYHPDVSSGRKTEEQVFSEFLESFDTISRDGTITLSELEHFYEYLSSTIQSDAYFISLVRNAWHLLGATGGNCLRVRITLGSRIDGRSGGIENFATVQKQVDIRPDLDCSIQDPSFKSLLFKRLAEMGYEDVVEASIISRT